MQNESQKQKSKCYNRLPFLAIVTGLLLCGCNSPMSRNRDYPINDHRSVTPYGYQRVEISKADIAQGLRRIFIQFSQDFGPFNAEPIIRDYTPVIRNALYRSGYCSIQKLEINDVITDIDIYFRSDDLQPTLTINTYLHGAQAPSYSVKNQYYAAASPQATRY